MTDLQADELADLQAQLEALLHQVWAGAAEWRLDDRIHLAVRVLPARPEPERQP
jgi:hypothetical protein